MPRLHVLGVGDAFTERYWNACLCIEEPSSGLRLLIDCPPALPRVLADHRQRPGADLSVWNLDHLLLTHLHGDHCGGLEAFLFMRRFLVRKKPALYGAKEVLDPLWETRLRGGMAHLTACVPRFSPAEVDARLQSPGLRGSAEDLNTQHQLGQWPSDASALSLSDYVDRVDLAPVTDIGPLRIERRFTYHHIPTTAIRVSLAGQDRPLLAYSADTAFDPDLIGWLAEAPLIIHETNFGIHTPLAALLDLPTEVRSRMRLIHYPDLLDPDTCPIPCLREGTILDLGPGTG